MPHVKTLSLLILLAFSTTLFGCWHANTMGDARLQSIGLPHNEVVVLVHGLNRSGRAMRSMAQSLHEEGYTVINCTYPSRSATIERLSDDLFARLDPQLKAAERVHFVTHSMGGLMLRARLEKSPLSNMGRVVMLGPPNGGSEVADSLREYTLFRWLNGPAGTQLGTIPPGVAATLAPPAFKPGVIAGDRTINPFLSMMIPGRDDGKVAVERAGVEGMGDFICLHATHACMMRNTEVIEQTKHYLKHGRFKTEER